MCVQVAAARPAPASYAQAGSHGAEYHGSEGEESGSEEEEGSSEEEEGSSEEEEGSSEAEEGSNDSCSHDEEDSNGSKTDTFVSAGHVECSGRGKTGVTADIAYKASTSAEVCKTGCPVTLLYQWQCTLCSVQDKIDGLHTGCNETWCIIWHVLQSGEVVLAILA